MTGALVPRVLVVVCDSWGVGDAPDAAAYGDEGSDTLANTAAAVGGIRAPNLAALGLGLLTTIRGGGRRGRTGERRRPRDRALGRQGHHHRSLGDDGDPPRRSVPALPGRFPGGPHRGVRAGDRPAGARGTAPRPARRSSPSSGRSTCGRGGRSSTRPGTPCSRSPTHKSVVDLAAALRVVARRRGASSPGRTASGRVIARPFEGEPGAFVRSPERRDFSVPPPGPTVLDRLQDAGVAVLGVGKIQDIFSGQGITEARYSDSNDHGVDLTLEYLRRPSPALRLHEPRGLRLQVRPSERPVRVRGLHRGVRPAAAGADRRPRRGRAADHR